MFLRVVVIEAVLSDRGTVAVDREELAMAVIIGKSKGRQQGQDLTKVAGRGSRGQVEVLDNMILVIC